LKQNNFLDEFASRFEELSGKVHRCSKGPEVISIIEQIIAERSQGKCYFTKEVLEFIREEDGDASLEQEFIVSAQMYHPQDNANGLEIIKEADVGITTADFGVAETGCLVEIAYADSTKLLSSLSRVNIILLRTKNILAEMQELAPVLRAILSKEDKPTITLISGPSRTSDIEMKSVLGVHGPHEVHALLLE
jgi:L-lactate dehydrogenase complex protein LldG